VGPSADALYEYLGWDSAFFGRRIARVTRQTLTPDCVPAIIEGCRRDGIDCLYFLADASHGPSIRLAEDHRFRLVDVRVTLQRRGVASFTSSPRPGRPVRESRPDDLSLLVSMAGRGFPLTRFHYDPNFPARLADALYERWIERSCHGYADAVLVADVGPGPVGFVSCHVRRAGRGQIGLLGVRDDQQGCGVGRDLVDAALHWYAGRGIDIVDVVTQGRNRAGLKLYQKCGFVVDRMELWYHRWFDEATDGPA
jgi:dTDP-4-amino-4,6-dideoxy-D-galactose acyltransferase